MSVYQVDLLDDEGKVSSSGHVVRRNDKEALRRAARMIGRRQALEIWDDTRVVGQVTWEECWQLKHRSTRPSRVLVRQPSHALG
ncbi:MAG TPA: hypothetical protein VKI44_41995 [Acetobacteraceae bacterium]|nr:hypothetical protein [Acetobacteraceae bacterium]